MNLVPLSKITQGQLLKLLEKKGSVEVVLKSHGHYQGLLRRTSDRYMFSDKDVFLMSNCAHRAGGWEGEEYSDLFEGHHYKHAYCITFTPSTYETLKQEIFLKGVTLFDLL